MSDHERRALQAVIEHVADVAPDACEGRSYGMPALLLHGKPLLGFTASMAHLAVYPFSPAAVEAVTPQLDGYKVSKGTVRFTEDRPIPTDVLTQLVRHRMAEITGG